MPKRKQTTYTRLRTKKRRVAKRPNPYSAVSLSKQTFKFKLVSVGGQFKPNSNGAYFGRSHVQMSDMIGWGNYTTLFDEYRIKSCTTKFFVSMLKKSDPLEDYAFYSTRLVTAVDYDGGDPPPSVVSVLGHTNSKDRIMKPQVMYSVTYVPHVLAVVGENSGSLPFRGTNTKSNQWIDTSNSNLKHHGFLYATQCSPWHTPANKNPEVLIIWETTAIVEFRQPRSGGI